VGAQVAARIVKRLVDRAPGRSEALGEDVDGDLVQRGRDQDLALVRRERRADTVADRLELLCLLEALRGRAGRAEALPGLRLGVSSRSCQARRRAFTAASRIANFAAQVVNRLAPR